MSRDIREDRKAASTTRFVQHVAGTQAQAAAPGIEGDLARENERLRAELARFRSRVICAYCLEETGLDADAMVAHQAVCPQRQEHYETVARAAIAEADALRKDHEEGRRLLDEGTRLVDGAQREIEDLRARLAEEEKRVTSLTIQAAEFAVAYEGTHAARRKIQILLDAYDADTTWSTRGHLDQVDGVRAWFAAPVPEEEAENPIRALRAQLRTAEESVARLAAKGEALRTAGDDVIAALREDLAKAREDAGRLAVSLEECVGTMGAGRTPIRTVRSGLYHLGGTAEFESGTPESTRAREQAVAICTRARTALEMGRGKY